MYKPRKRKHNAINPIKIQNGWLLRFIDPEKFFPPMGGNKARLNSICISQTLDVA
jgi:hypothetical protein